MSEVVNHTNQPFDPSRNRNLVVTEAILQVFLLRPVKLIDAAFLDNVAVLAV